MDGSHGSKQGGPEDPNRNKREAVIHHREGFGMVRDDEKKKGTSEQDKYQTPQVMSYPVKWLVELIGAARGRSPDGKPGHL